MIHEADPQLRPVMITIFTHAVRPYFSKSAKQNKVQEKTGFANVSLAEGIIDDTCLVVFYLNSRISFRKIHKKNISLQATITLN